MKKNGFTLVELLAVIIILSLIMLITVVAVRPIINDSKNELSEIQKKKIEEAAESYYLKEGMDKDVTCVNAQKLIDNGYIDESAFELVETGESWLGYVKIETTPNGKVTYTYQIQSCE